MAQPVTLRGITKRFGEVVAVRDFSLEIKGGEVVTLLGPSGCGKTTTLRMIAGLERPDSGELVIGDRVVNSSEKAVFVPPERRGIGMVFQSYAVWPHMTVFDNVAFPLALRRKSRAEQQEAVQRTLALVGLKGLDKRYATALSGGQQQRVALARALVNDPELLLLDEPLSNLDAALREQMRVELRALQRRLGITAVFVTHDQVEAIVLSDRIVVMNQGQVEEVGTPRDIVERPKSKFTMDFVGRINYIPGRVVGRSPEGYVVELSAPQQQFIAATPAQPIAVGEQILLCVRPEDIEIVPSENGPARPNTWTSRVELAVYLGDRVDYLVRLGDLDLRVNCPPSVDLSEGAQVVLSIPPKALRVWALDVTRAPAEAASRT